MIPSRSLGGPESPSLFLWTLLTVEKGSLRLSLSHFLINFVLLLEDRLKVIRRRTTVAFSLY